MDSCNAGDRKLTGVISNEYVSGYKREGIKNIIRTTVSVAITRWSKQKLAPEGIGVHVICNKKKAKEWRLSGMEKKQQINLEYLVAKPIFKNETLFKFAVTGPTGWRTDRCTVEYNTGAGRKTDRRPDEQEYQMVITYTAMKKSVCFPCHMYQQQSDAQISHLFPPPPPPPPPHPLPPPGSPPPPPPEKYQEDVESLRREADELKEEINSLFQKNKELAHRRDELMGEYKREKEKAEKEKADEEKLRIDADDLLQELADFLKQKSKSEIKRHEAAFSVNKRK